jgi:hypothetical protein
MKPWHRYTICILLGLGVGSAIAVWQIRSDYAVKQVKNGPWSANTDQGTAKASALTRAKVALNGLLALPAQEAMYYIARTDSDGAPLDGRCTYFVIGRKLAASWWSLTLYQGEGWLVKNEANRWSVAGQNLQTNPLETGKWLIIVSPSKYDGAWLPTGRAKNFDLTLRVYHPQGDLLNNPAKAELPFIRKEFCK